MARVRARDNERALIETRLAQEAGTLCVGQPASIVMAYPSPYRVGMSSLGFQTLYRQLNEQGFGAHRAFLPDAWEKGALPWPQPKIPILSYEGKRPVSDYPIIGMSVAYELELAGLIRFLEGAGIPVFAADRSERDPIIIGGGPLTDSNPSLLLPFVDLLICGEAEQALPAAIEAIQAVSKRSQGLQNAAALDHTVLGEVERGEFSPLPEAASVPKELLPAYSAITTPDTELSNMFLIEPERGCSRRCTFCVMRGESTGGMRLLDMEKVLSLIPEHAKKVGLVGAAVTDHPQLESLVHRIVQTGRGIGISSLRADRLTPTLLENLAAGGYRTITIASDGISERMRDVLNRKISEASLFAAAKMVGQRKFHRLKVYEMMGAPGETDADADELVRTAIELSKLTRLALTFSTFVAKRNTPLDGQPFMGIKAAEERLRRIREGLKGHGIELRPQPPKWAWVEYELAQRGPEVGRAVFEAVHAGGRFADYKRALAKLPENTRQLRFGDEQARARREGFAAKKPRLPVIA